MDHYVRRDDFADALFDRITKRVNLFEAGGSRHADRGVHKMAVSCTAHAYAIHREYAFHTGDGPSEFLLQSLRCGIEQGVYGAAAPPRNHPPDDRGHRRSGPRVRIK